MKKQLSVLLSELSVKTKNMEESASTAKANTEEKIKDWAKDVKDKMADSKAAFNEKKKTLAGDAKSHWEKMKDNFDNEVTRIKTEFNKTKQDLKAKDAAAYADWAEDDAEMSLYFALNAVADAEDALVEAIGARMKADSFK